MMMLVEEVAVVVVRSRYSQSPVRIVGLCVIHPAADYTQ